MIKAELLLTRRTRKRTFRGYKKFLTLWHLRKANRATRKEDLAAA